MSLPQTTNIDPDTSLTIKPDISENIRCLGS